MLGLKTSGQTQLPRGARPIEVIDEKYLDRDKNGLW